MPTPIGYRHSAEARKKMSLARRGKRFTEEHRRNLSLSQKGMKRERNLALQCLNCGSDFKAANAAKFCSKKCSKGMRRVTLLHSPDYRSFAKACAVCGRTDELVGDHDHATGTPRGILCRTCNLAAGNVRDNPAIASRLAAYLRGEL